MTGRIGIRREDKNEWERRVPLVPTDVAYLQREEGIEVLLQPFPARAYHDGEYLGVGARIDENLTGCKVIIGIKEMPDEFFREGLTYAFFSHVIKGQQYNMPMLRKLLDLGCSLIDYEKITDDTGRRLVFFGSEAGQAGIIDTLWALGRRLTDEGIDNPFTGVRHAIEYKRLTEAESALDAVGRDIIQNGIPDDIHPVIVGFAGYGNVATGAQEILGHLPVIEISPEQLMEQDSELFTSSNHVYKVIFREEHMVEPVDPDQPFELQDYYNNPEKYRGVFEKYVPGLTVLMNCIYWDEKYPRLVSVELVRSLYSSGKPKLVVIGDISIDVEGAIEVSVKATDSGNPIYVYDVDSGEAIDGVTGNGPVILAVDNLPCELPREASARFSSTLKGFVPELANSDFSVPFESLEISDPLKRAVICYHGNLTPDYKYISEFLLT